MSIFRNTKSLKKSYIREVDGQDVLTKTEDFRLYIIMKDETIIGTVLLTEGQASILNCSCNEHGIKFVKKP